MDKWICFHGQLELWDWNIHPNDIITDLTYYNTSTRASKAIDLSIKVGDSKSLSLEPGTYDITVESTMYYPSTVYGVVLYPEGTEVTLRWDGYLYR